MSNAIIGTGVLVKAGDGGSPEVFTAVAEQVQVTPPGKSRNEIDVSNHNEGVEAKILGMIRRGQLKLKVNWVPTDPTHDQMNSDFDTNTKRNWQVTLPGVFTFTFAARVQMFTPPDITTDTALQLDIAMTVDGAVTYVNS